MDEVHKALVHQFLIQGEQIRWHEVLFANDEDGVAGQDGIRFSEASQDGYHGNGEREVTASGISSYDKLLDVQTKEIFGILQDPHVGLIAVTDGGREWMLRRKSVVNAEYGDLKFVGPLAGIVLMS